MELVHVQNPDRLPQSYLPDQTIRFEKQYPREVIRNILLELYKSLRSLQTSPNFWGDRIKAIQRSLAACCLVCRQWHEIFTSIRGWGSVLERSKRSLVPSLPNHELQPTLLQWSGAESDLPIYQWLPRNYTTALVDSHPKFLPELVPNLIHWIDVSLTQSPTYFNGYSSRKAPRTLAACCLVCREWNKIVTPILYKDITLPLDEDTHLSSQSLLQRTLRHTKPAHKALVKIVSIVPAKDRSIADFLSICLSMPNLHKLMLDFKELDPTTLHPNLGYYLRFLSKRCTIQMAGGYNGRMNIDWESWPKWVSFIRHSRTMSILSNFNIDDKEGE